MDNFHLFSKAIFNRFFVNTPKGVFVVLSIDNQLFESLCDAYQIHKEQLFIEVSQNFKYDWNIALENSNDGIPNFLALIGIQIYTAHLMRKEEYCSENAYNPRLCRLLKVDEPQLQSLYTKFQEKIWREFEKWAEQKGYFIDLPPKKEGKGRHIQYPLSQSLLNQEDLKWLPSLFQKAGLRPSEPLSFKNFRSIISGSDRGAPLTTHYYRLKDQLSSENRLHVLEKQIFSYYLSWDGKLPFIESSKINIANVKKRICSGNLVLRIEDIFSCIFKILIFDENENTTYKIDSFDKDLFEKIHKRYRLFHKNKEIILFIKNEDYDNEWDESRFLERQHPCLILCRKERTYIQDYLHELDKKFHKYTGELYDLYQVDIPEDKRIISCYQFLFSNSNRPFHVQNGLKLSRKSWLFGAGPDFLFEKPVRVWLNGEKKEINELRFSCRDLGLGEYVLNIEDHTPFSFCIENYNNEEFNDFPCEHKCGWNVNLKGDYKQDEANINISGLYLNFPIVDDLSEHRKWINALLKKKLKSKNIDTLVTKAIVRSY